MSGVFYFVVLWGKRINAALRLRWQAGLCDAATVVGLAQRNRAVLLLEP
jgi:hypothetical protein